MERDQIERRDFPSARRGYDTAAVQEHLRRVADAFEALARPAAATLAEGASERVRAILEAAEASAEQLRAEAGREASTHVERVEESAQQMLAKLDRVQAELDRLRSTAESLAGELEQLRHHARALPGAEEAGRTEPEPSSNGGDEAGARLVALNMALEGIPRDEAGRYLDEHYELPGIDALLDDVYTSAGK